MANSFLLKFTLRNINFNYLNVKHISIYLILICYGGFYNNVDGVRLYKLVFPQVGKKFLPGDGQDVVGKGTDRVLADQDEILKYTFFF